jgi:predicted nuclease with TOPRIM domain
MSDKLDLLLDKVGRIENDVQELKTDVHSLKSGQSELYQIYRALRDRQDKSDAKLDGMAMDVHRMQGDVTALKEVQIAMQSDIAVMRTDISELKEGQRVMLSIQQEQQKILERLSIRSVSQEADIAELRRIK